jgi:hypothetical protein
MQTQNPQEAFFTWLGQALGRAIDAVRGPDGDVVYLAASVDHADLERRLRVLQRGAGSPISQLTY